MFIDVCFFLCGQIPTFRVEQAFFFFNYLIVSLDFSFFISKNNSALNLVLFFCSQSFVNQIHFFQAQVLTYICPDNGDI